MDRRTCLVTRGYDAARALLEAIRLSGDPDNPEAIRDGFYKIKNLPLAGGNKSSMGSFEVGRNALLGPSDIPVYVIRSGKLEIAR